MEGKGRSPPDASNKNYRLSSSNPQAKKHYSIHYYNRRKRSPQPSSELTILQGHSMQPHMDLLHPSCAKKNSVHCQATNPLTSKHPKRHGCSEAPLRQKLHSPQTRGTWENPGVSWIVARPYPRPHLCFSSVGWPALAQPCAQVESRAYRKAQQGNPR